MCAHRQVSYDELTQIVALFCSQRWGGNEVEMLFKVDGKSVLDTTVAMRPQAEDGPAPHLTDCMTACLDVLEAAARRLTRPEIVEALHRAGKRYSDSTVSHDLAKLVKSMGLMTNAVRPDRHGRGYGLAVWDA